MRLLNRRKPIEEARQIVNSVVVYNAAHRMVAQQGVDYAVAADVYCGRRIELHPTHHRRS